MNRGTISRMRMSWERALVVYSCCQDFLFAWCMSFQFEFLCEMSEQEGSPQDRTPFMEEQHLWLVTTKLPSQ